MSPSAARSTRVLLVEDSLIDARLMRAMVESMPRWEVVHADSLAAARRIAAESGDDIDLVVVDLSLPDAHGLEAVEFARDQLPAAVCVVSTGEKLLSTAMDALRIGATDYIVKGSLDRQNVQRALQLASLRRDLLRQSKDNENNLRAVLGAMNEALVVIDDVGRVLLRNPLAEALAIGQDGVFPTSTIGTDPGDVTQTSATNRAGVAVPVEVRVAPLTWGGGEARLVIARDLSDEHAAQRLRDRANHAEELAQIGGEAFGDWHDIRQKLMVLQELLPRLEAGEAPDGDDVAFMRTFHRELLAVSDKYRRGAVSMRNVRAEVDMPALVRSKCAALQLRLHADADLVARIGDVPTVLGDEVELGSALENLLFNAADALRGVGRRGRITVSLDAVDAEVHLRVSDDGPGFPTGKDIVGTTSKPHGSGIGLARVRRTAERHGGRMELHSSEGHGATVKVCLPAARTKPAAEGRRVLLIDDDELVARSARRALKGAYTVEVAHDGAEALEVLARDKAFDAILCDLEMPRLDGPGFYERLSEVAPDLRQRMAFCSGGASTPEMLAFLQRAQLPMLPKPFDRSAAIALVEALAEGQGSTLAHSAD